MKVPLSLLSLLLLLLLSLPSSSYLASSLSRGLLCRSRALTKGLQCYGSDDAPGDSDYGSTAIDDVSIGSCGIEEGVCQLKLDIIAACDRSNRGKDIAERENIGYLVSSLIKETNKKNDLIKTNLLIGHWELLYIDDDITRASPFFWSFRKAFRDIEDPFKIVGPKLLSESIFKLTDDIPFKAIGKCQQDITSDGKLINKVEVKVSNLPFDSRSLMQTTSSWLTTQDESIIELKVDKTQVLDSTIEGVVKNTFLSFLNPAEFPFPSGDALELIRSGSSTVFMKILYLDEELRVCKNIQDDKTLIFRRI